MDALAGAVGLSGGSRHAFVRRWTGYVEVNTPFQIDGGRHRLVHTEDEVRWSVAFLDQDGTVLEPPYLEIVFTPTERRTVADVDAETCFERIATSEEIRADRLAD